MTILEKISLKPYNTFDIEVKADYFTELTNFSEILEILQHPVFMSNPRLILGRGSNILLTKDFKGIVVKINTKGIEVVKETNEHIFLKVQAGEEWNDFVDYCMKQNYGGIENLAFIPGNTGSAPIQNIGAYGIEVKDCIEEVEFIGISDFKKQILKNQDCCFGYRNSIFKNELKQKVIITAVTFKLTKKNHILQLDYVALKKEIEKAGIKNPSIQDVAQIVQKIRTNKLPNPKEIGNAGSFFKNPTIEMELFNRLITSYPTIPYYKQDDNLFKIPAAWLIEQSGWKGFREGDAGVHCNQALVLVNYKNASGSDILNLAQKIQQAVLNKFNIAISMEVNVY